MKLMLYIASIIIIVYLGYCAGFSFFYGMAMEDSIILIKSVLFTILMCYFAKWTKIKNNEYTKKILNLIKKLCEDY